MDEEALQRAAEIVAEAGALLITAGAGFGVDSGLPDFRGDEGFWNAYPPYRGLGKRFIDMENPDGFRSDPPLAWGFYGHRLALYRETEPHAGFHRLREWGEAKPGGAFVMTSNVDEHFQRAGFSPDRIYEVHGSIHHLQCSQACDGSGIWEADDVTVEIDPDTMRATGELPACPHCGAVARPNILMFGDWAYLGDRNEEQRRRRLAWLDRREGERVAVLEFGAGSAVPTVRLFSEDACRRLDGATLIRVNPREPEVSRGEDVGIAAGALETIEAIGARMEG